MYAAVRMPQQWKQETLVAVTRRARELLGVARRPSSQLFGPSVILNAAGPPTETAADASMEPLLLTGAVLLVLATSPLFVPLIREAVGRILSNRRLENLSVRQKQMMMLAQGIRIDSPGSREALQHVLQPVDRAVIDEAYVLLRELERHFDPARTAIGARLLGTMIPELGRDDRAYPMTRLGVYAVDEDSAVAETALEEIRQLPHSLIEYEDWEAWYGIAKRELEIPLMAKIRKAKAEPLRQRRQRHGFALLTALMHIRPVLTERDMAVFMRLKKDSIQTIILSPFEHASLTLEEMQNALNTLPDDVLDAQGWQSLLSNAQERARNGDAEQWQMMNTLTNIVRKHMVHGVES